MLEIMSNFERKCIFLFLSDMAEKEPTNGTDGSQNVNKEEDTPSLVRIYKNPIQSKCVENRIGSNRYKNKNFEQTSKIKMAIIKPIIIQDFCLKQK